MAVADDPPEAPPQWDNTEAAAWQQGWTAGILASEQRLAALEAALREARYELRICSRSFVDGELHRVSALTLGTIDAALGVQL